MPIFYQRVEDNTFHLGGSTAPKAMPKQTPEAQNL